MATATVKPRSAGSPGATRREPLIEEFHFDHDTKGAVAYKQEAPTDGSRPSIGSIYFTKPVAAAHNLGKRLRITVETID